VTPSSCRRSPRRCTTSSLPEPSLPGPGKAAVVRPLHQPEADPDRLHGRRARRRGSGLGDVREPPPAASGRSGDRDLPAAPAPRRCKTSAFTMPRTWPGDSSPGHTRACPSRRDNGTARGRRSGRRSRVYRTAQQRQAHAGSARVRLPPGCPNVSSIRAMNRGYGRRKEVTSRGQFGGQNAASGSWYVPAGATES
jgi:hypothetical protein